MRMAAVTALSVLLPSAVLAQPAGLLQQQQRLRLDESRPSTVDPNVEAPYALPIPMVSLETASADGRAKATIGFAKVQATYRFTFEAPIGKAADSEANPLSLTGLGNDATATFAYSNLFLFRKYNDKTVLDFCAAHSVSPCSDQGFTDPDTRKQFLAIAIREHPSLVSFSAQVGAPAFEYRNRTTLAPVESKMVSHKVTASYAMLLLPNNVFSVNVAHSRSYSASKDTTSLCTPLADTSVAGAVRCDDVTLGEPKARNVWGMTLEFRYQIVKDNVPMFGLSPRFNLKLDDPEASSVEVPIYFLQRPPTKDAGALLNGGVNTGWSKKAGYVVKVFIGAGFSLIGQ